MDEDSGWCAFGRFLLTSIHDPAEFPKVSADTGLERSARACHIRWLSEVHQGVNRQPWPESERKTLLSLADHYRGQELDWTHIARALNVNHTSSVVI